MPCIPPIPRRKAHSNACCCGLDGEGLFAGSRSRSLSHVIVDLDKADMLFQKRPCIPGRRPQNIIGMRRGTQSMEAIGKAPRAILQIATLKGVPRCINSADLSHSALRFDPFIAEVTAIRRQYNQLSTARQACQYLRNFLAGVSCISEPGRYLHVGGASRLPTSPSSSLEARTGYMLAFYVYAGMISPGRRLKARLASDRLICRLAVRPCEKCLFGSLMPRRRHRRGIHIAKDCFPYCSAG